MSEIKNINLEVASFAIEKVKNVCNNKKMDKNYKTLVKKMPALIQKNGLILTLVFNWSKVEKLHHKEVLKNIIHWHKQNSKIKDFEGFKEVDFDKNEKDTKVIEKYIKAVTDLDQREYRLLTKEMMSLFGWIKRFAEGMIEGEE
ncbi:type III-B CRISPR module-associated protein Cmr5 [Crassaminicella indica]|uniref:Type III-B CRISPR module-associated protein Cmr5 n=1 Tax=Crassaminicella indica TaxID=2855394 RepID=A0ABX8RAA7_9CLOT|nr:type III-B CRISPR module-associated protein Cmr5 [Crassaminicella indica]QXM05372.1 type III-B CRISPR module-associated protein Cmr5 [Crassaminicella indica]